MPADGFAAEDVALCATCANHEPASE
jgi:hypothetical protein